MCIRRTPGVRHFGAIKSGILQSAGFMWIYFTFAIHFPMEFPETCIIFIRPPVGCTPSQCTCACSAQWEEHFGSNPVSVHPTVTVLAADEVSITFLLYLLLCIMYAETCNISIRLPVGCIPTQCTCTCSAQWEEHFGSIPVSVHPTVSVIAAEALGGRS